MNFQLGIHTELWPATGRGLLGRGYIEARTDTTQQSGQTPDKEVEIKNITVYVSGYTEGPDSQGR